nr:hypothetical protein [Cupriavidus sp. LEh21]
MATVLDNGVWTKRADGPWHKKPMRAVLKAVASGRNFNWRQTGPRRMTRQDAVFLDLGGSCINPPKVAVSALVNSLKGGVQPHDLQEALPKHSQVAVGRYAVVAVVLCRQLRRRSHRNHPPVHREQQQTPH